jgi:hypothetical protein
MNEPFVRQLTASVLFVRPRGEAPWSPAEGIDDPVRLAAARAVSRWPLDRRVVLEAAEGIAIVGLGDPREAQAGATRAAADPSIAVGLDHGAVQFEGDGDRATRGSGEAIEHALAESGRASTGAVGQSDRFAAATAALRRRTLLGAAAIGGVLVLGGGARLVRQRIDAANRPAVIQLQIQPWGEVFVDGQPKGTAPPLVRLWIAPGAHTIEVRNGRFKPLKMQVDLKPGEELQIAHTFASTPARRRSLWERLKFW